MTTMKLTLCCDDDILVVGDGGAFVIDDVGCHIVEDDWILNFEMWIADGVHVDYYGVAVDVDVDDDDDNGLLKQQQ